MNFTFNDLMLLYDYHVTAVLELNEIWYRIGDEAYVEMMSHYRVANAIEREIERRMENV